MDEVGQRGNDLGVWNREAVAEIVEERDTQFLARLHEAEAGVATVAAGLAPGAAGDLALGDVTADVVLRAVGMERDLGPIEDPKQLGLPGMETLQ